MAHWSWDCKAMKSKSGQQHFGLLEGPLMGPTYNLDFGTVKPPYNLQNLFPKFHRF